jgi:glycosyltransferase involved in cell wall biosynthesis
LDQVLSARSDVDVAFVGHATGPIALALTGRAAQSGGRLRVLGFVPEIADHLAEFALVLVPSRSEGFGRVAVEALRAGVPVLATRVEGLVEALQELSDPWLPDARDQWPARILRELDAPTHTPDQLRAAALRFDPERFTDDVLDCYREVLAARRRTATEGTGAGSLSQGLLSNR